jgi:hypothetical protein
MRTVTLTLAMLVLVAASLVSAQVTQCPPSSPRAQQQPAGPQAMDVAVVEGNVTSVAPDLQLFRIRDLGGKSTAIHVTPRTRIMFPDGNIASLSDLREGQRVQASFRVSQAGQAVADQVNIMSGAARPHGRRQGLGGGPAGGWK